MRIISASILFIILSSVNLSAAEELPVEYFASLPDVSQMQLSPSGNKVASLVRLTKGGIKGTGLLIHNRETQKNKIPLYAENEKFVINWVRWANEKQMLVSAIYPAVRYGTPTTETRLLILDIESGKTRSAIPKRYVKEFAHVPQFQDQVIDMMEDDEDHFLLEVDGKVPGYPTVYKVSLNRKKMVGVQRAKTNIDSWQTDRQHRVRIGFHIDETTYKIKHRLPDSKKWRTLWEFEAFSADQVWPLGFDEDPNILYIRTLHEGRYAVFSVNVQDPELKKELVYSNPHYDVDGSLVYSNLSKKVIGVRAPDDNGYIFWDTQYKGLYKAINKALKDTDNIFISMSRDEKSYIVLSLSDIDPGVYFIGDREKKTLDPSAFRYKRLTPDIMAEKQWITYKARDGLEIEAAMTLPKNRKKDEKVPTIIFPHGGPISYDGNGFDYWTQFFANRGYAVLQMNFRGSSGYGYDFMKAGLQNWGLAMQDDVEDGARWMIENGYADPDKMCIVGASYGGYAALMGTVKSPELYKCAVSFAGVMDVAYLMKVARRYSNYEIVKEQIGTNLKDLKKRSPLHNADEIDIPVLLIHGTKDRSVRVQHSKRMFTALEKRQKDVKYLELKDGTHYLSNNENRIAAFEAMDKFLKQHLSN